MAKSSENGGKVDPIDAAREYVASRISEEVADDPFVRELQTARVFMWHGGSVSSEEDGRLTGIFADAWVTGYLAATRIRQQASKHSRRTADVAERSKRIRRDASRLRADGLSQGEIVLRLGKRYKLGRSAIYSAIGPAK